MRAWPLLLSLLACGGPEAPVEPPAVEMPAATGLARVTGTWAVDIGAHAPPELRFLDALFAQQVVDRAPLVAILAEVEDEARRTQLEGLIALRETETEHARLAEARAGLEQLRAVRVAFAPGQMELSVGPMRTVQPVTVTEESAERIAFEGVREDGQVVRTELFLMADGAILLDSETSPPLSFRRVAEGP